MNICMQNERRANLRGKQEDAYKHQQKRPTPDRLTINLSTLRINIKICLCSLMQKERKINREA